VIPAQKKATSPNAHSNDGGRAGHARVAIFSDTLDEVNGVSLSIMRLAETAQRRGIEAEVLTSRGTATGRTALGLNFRALVGRPLPPYPEMSLVVPPVLEVVRYVNLRGFTAIHVATPGPMGLVALLAAKVLHLPISGTFHTNLPSYAGALLARASWQKNTWRYVMAFYSALDEVFVPSKAVAEELLRRGLPPSRVQQLPYWVDSVLFTPQRRDGELWERYGAGVGAKSVYAGRVSREKNMPLLVDAFRDLVDDGHRATLVVAGDGPYRPEMERRLAGYPALFLGFVSQRELAAVYASADLFVFPSTTDTLGLVVLEAQAAGLPVIVSSEGGPHEIMRHGRTGLVVPANDRAALMGALRWFVENPQRRREMGRAARDFVLANVGAPSDHADVILSRLGMKSPREPDQPRAWRVGLRQM
jgi:glycosyltransferase involved in cell wall biosynthesis